MSNLSVWGDLAETDPKAKNNLNFGRKITAIDATWQVWRMTERFGKIGEGWGWETDDVKVVQLAAGETMVLVTVSVWSEKREHKFGGFTGGAMLFSKNRADDDAAKKATTDALTKALSHLGMSADVFMSKFDDCKYTSKPESDRGVTPPQNSGQGGSQVSSLPDEPPASITPTIKRVTEKSPQEQFLDKMMNAINSAADHSEAVEIVRAYVTAAKTLDGVEMMFNRIKPTNDAMIKIFSDRKYDFMKAKAEEIRNG